MSDCDLIDLDLLDFSDDQTWLYKLPEDSGQKVDIVDWTLSLEWPFNNDPDYQKQEANLCSLVSEIFKSDGDDSISLPDKHKFDSRTYVRPKKRPPRPSIQNMVDVVNAGFNGPLLSPNPSSLSGNKYLTYNKYNSPISPMLRLKTFNVDTNSENSTVVREYAMKRRSLVQDDDPQLEDISGPPDMSSGRPSMEHTPGKINIDLTQPAHNIHNTFNKGVSNVMCERSSLNMYQSGESLMRMSPPSLVSSINMESSGNFNMESLEGRKSLMHRDSGLPTSGRESIDPMVTSMTLSILDEKDMSTSFLSQTTYQDNESLLDSLPPSLVSSVNSSYIVPNIRQRQESQVEPNIFSSATFTRLEQSEKLLSARPRCQMFNSFNKRESLRNSESYTKAREEGCQIDTTRKESPVTTKMSPEMSETITLHYANNKFRKDVEEKENRNATFEKDDTFYREMDVQRPSDSGKESLNKTMDKKELNEIIQARQKLSLARKGLPVEDKTIIQNQPDIKTIQLPNQTIAVPKHSMENASELLSRRRMFNGHEKETVAREPPKRNATFKKTSPKASMDATIVFTKPEDNNIIDINSATMNLIDGTERPVTEDWNPQERAMVGSNESTDTATFSSSSPPESVPDPTAMELRAQQIASTPLPKAHKPSRTDLLSVHNTISPIYDTMNDKSYTFSKNQANIDRTNDLQVTVINSKTLVKKPAAKRELMSGNVFENRVPASPPERNVASRLSPPNTTKALSPPVNSPIKSGLPTSKLRQYSSHRELNRIPGPSSLGRGLYGGIARGAMTRRTVYASNPALSPTAPAPAFPASCVAPPLRRESYTITQVERENDRDKNQEKPAPTPVLVRQGTETLRRERPQSQLVAPKDFRVGPGAPSVPVGVTMPTRQTSHLVAPATRPYSIAGASQLRSRPTSGPGQRPTVMTATSSEPRPQSGNEAKASGLPRPSRLPAPRRGGLRPPSVYSVAPSTTDVDHY